MAIPERVAKIREKIRDSRLVAEATTQQLTSKHFINIEQLHYLAGDSRSNPRKLSLDVTKTLLTGGDVTVELLSPPVLIEVINGMLVYDYQELKHPSDEQQLALVPLSAVPSKKIVLYKSVSGRTTAERFAITPLGNSPYLACDNWCFLGDSSGNLFLAQLK